MEEGARMDFQLTQAKLRGVIGTLAVVTTVVFPVLGWAAVRYVDVMDEVGDNLSKVAITVAVLSNDVSTLKDNVRSLELYVRGPSVRPGNFVIPAPVETPIHSIKL